MRQNDIMQLTMLVVFPVILLLLAFLVRSERQTLIVATSIPLLALLIGVIVTYFVVSLLYRRETDVMHDTIQRLEEAIRSLGYAVDDIKAVAAEKSIPRHDPAIISDMPRQVVEKTDAESDA